MTSKNDPNPAPRYAYVGSRTTRERNSRGEGISVYAIEADGRLRLTQVFGGLVNPSFLALNSDRSRLYTVHGDGHDVSVLAVDPEHGTLSLLQTQECGGLNPVHLALDPTEQWLLVSDHLGVGRQGGALLVMPVLSDGTLGPVCQRVEMTGTPGPHRKEQPHAKPHCNVFDPNGRYVVVPDKGLDRVFVFPFVNGEIVEGATRWADTRAGAGPRHVAFHPSLSTAYVVNELDSTVTAYRFDKETGVLNPFQILSTLPDSFIGNNTGSGIAISHNGCYLYTSNRGHDSIATFAIDLLKESLSFQGTTSSMGRTPRFFTMDRKGTCFYVLNEDSDSIVVFSVDPEEGAMGTVLDTLDCASPVCLVM
ncbi:3-carboxymuconate cyclase [Acidovorax sp. CF316]|uniref:lactonase family protein n=1 Tax=Acidovorax sp. CF316 TaxID=1144317 RepID=UPI00026BCF37|nr:lactonase family protein [Acidovorax sp. CF316]EJE53338.1 3-carboxymuconate cyclase [Acidovorax sp. CF316]